MQQLATALVFMSENTPNKKWPEAISILKELLLTLDETSFDQEKTIATILDLVHAYTKTKEFDLAEMYIANAEEKIRGITSKFSSVPVEILEERIVYAKAVLSKEQGDLRGAAALFTHCIEANQIYDPAIRCKSLKQLRDIFEHREVDCSDINLLLEDFEVTNKDIVFLLDYSESMKHQNRIQQAIDTILSVFDRFVDKDDRVAFITFNKDCHIAFNLTPKGQNTAFLRQHIMKCTRPSGQTAFYDAVAVALDEFTAYSDSSECECELLQVGDRPDDQPAKRARWILALTDGEDTCSGISYGRLKAKLE